MTTRYPFQSHIKRLYLPLIFLFITALASAQEWRLIIEQANTKKFDELVRLVENYFEGKDKGKGSGYKQWQRWVEFNRMRLDANGNVVNVSQFEMEEINKLKDRRSTQGRIITPGGGNWSPFGPFSHYFANHVGRINCVTVDPVNSSVIYVGAPGGGLWRSVDDGKTWSCLTETITSIIGISSIAIDPTSPATNRTIYLQTGDRNGGEVSSIGILKSTDNGSSWVRVGGTLSSGYKLIHHPTISGTLFFSGNFAINKSVDGGQTWVQKITGHFTDVEFHPTNPSILYAAGYSSGNATRSLNGGETWQPATGIPQSFTRQEIAVSAANPSVVYIFQDRKGGLYKSTDQGATYQQVPNGSFGVTTYAGYCLAFAVSPINASELYIGGVTSHKSTDGGVTWVSEFTGHADQHAYDFYTGYLYIGNDGGVVRKNMSTGAYEDISSGLNITQIYRFGHDKRDPSRIIIGMQDNGTGIVSDSHADYVYGGDGIECFIDSNTEWPLTYFTLQNGVLFRKEERTNQIRNITPPGLDGGQWITPFTPDPNHGRTVYSGYVDLYKKIGNEGWVNLTRGTVAPGHWVGFIAVAPSNSNYIYILKNGLYRTANGGQTWTNLPWPSPRAAPHRVYIHPDNPDIIWGVCANFVSGNKVFKSVNGGSTWTNISGSLPNVPVNCAVYQLGSKNGIYVGTDVGVFYRDDTRSDWVPYDSGMPYAIITDLEINHPATKLFASTYGRGAWVSDLYPGSVERGIHVSFFSPQSTDTFTSPTTILLQATPTAIGGSVAKVEFFNGENKLGESTGPDYYFYYWHNVGGGNYQLIAKATSTTGATDTATVNIHVGGVASCAGNGTITEEIWTGVSGGQVSSIPVNEQPDVVREMTSFAAPLNSGDLYGRRVRGYLCILETGDYTFSISSDNSSELWLSPDMNPANKTRIAYVTGYTSPGQYFKYPSQTSAPVRLEAGKQYYIEALHKESSDNDHLNVAWRGPGFNFTQVIPGQHLRPFLQTDNPPTVSITAPANNSQFTAPATINITASASDTDGMISKVEFYNGTTKLGEDITSPYSYSWTNVPAGNYTINAKAIDNLGSSASASVSVSVTTAALCANIGKIVREVWSNVSGSGVSLIPVNTPPTATSELTIFQAPANTGDNYGARVRGFICVPTSGNYIFWITSDDNSELHLSTDDNPANKKLIAWTKWTLPNQWNKYTNQQSVPVNLVAGRRYYIEALHKEAAGNDHLAVGMTLPDGTLERPILGSRLIPFSSNALPIVTITSPANGQSFSAPATISIAANASDSDGTIAKVEFYNGTTKLGEDISSPYTYQQWTNVAAGNYEIQAKAFDNLGAIANASVAVSVSSGTCTAQGFIEREIWTGIPGTAISSIPVNATPNAVTTHSSFETPQYYANEYGSRMRGYVCVPLSGNYTFWIASDDNSQLWLSSDETAANKTMIASVTGATSLKAWDKYPSQKSAIIILVAGRRYYIEALHKEGGGNDHVAVGWQLPNGTFERPIPAGRLSPFTSTPAAPRDAKVTIAAAYADEGAEMEMFPNPYREGAITITLPVSGTTTQRVNVQIVGITGQVLFNTQVLCEPDCSTISVIPDRKLPAGLYIVNAIIDRKRYLKKLIVE